MSVRMTIEELKKAIDDIPGALIPKSPAHLQDVGDIALSAQRKLMRELLDGNGEFRHVPEVSSHGFCYCLSPSMIERLKNELGIEET